MLSSLKLCQTVLNLIQLQNCFTDSYELAINDYSKVLTRLLLIPTGIFFKYDQDQM